MTLPRLGYLCMFDNPSDEAARALTRQFVLVREADRMGYDDIWIGEQHFDGQWPSAAIVARLGHLAAVTSKARIGSMALLPGLHDPIRLAEDIATLDLLSKGRLNLGLASGGAFAPALQRFGIKPGAARARFLDMLDLMRERLHDDEKLVPRPAQAALPTWIASDHGPTLAQAARLDIGLMAAATHTESRVRAALAHYPDAARARLVLARFGCSAPTREQALAIARPYFEALAQRARDAGWGADPQRSMARDVDALLAHSLVGSHAEVADKVRRLGSELGVNAIALIPTSAQFDTHKHVLADFVDEVRPLLE